MKNIILLIIPNEKKTRMALYSSEKTIYIIKRNNTESLIKATAKFVEHIPSRNTMPAIWAFDYVENKHTLYRGKDRMKKFCYF